jgi:hypothetical protein
MAVRDVYVGSVRSLILPPNVVLDLDEIQLSIDAILFSFSLSFYYGLKILQFFAIKLVRSSNKLNKVANPPG